MRLRRPSELLLEIINNMYLRPGFVVVIVGCVLTGLSTLVVALRYVHLYQVGLLDIDTNEQILLPILPRRDCDHDRPSHAHGFGTLFVLCTLRLSLTVKVLTWGNLVVNYYMDETSSHTRPSYYRIPVTRS